KILHARAPRHRLFKNFFDLRRGRHQTDLQLRAGLSRDDVRSRAAPKSPNVARRLAEELIARPRARAQVREHVQNLFDRRLAALRICRVRRAPTRRQSQSKRTLRADGELVLRRLAVNEVLALARERVRVRGARAESFEVRRDEAPDLKLLA